MMSVTAQSKGCAQDIVYAHWQGQLSIEEGRQDDDSLRSGGTDEFQIASLEALSWIDFKLSIAIDCSQIVGLLVSRFYTELATWYILLDELSYMRRVDCICMSKREFGRCNSIGVTL